MLLSTCKVLAIPMADGDTLELENIREAAKYFKISQHSINNCIENGDSAITDIGEFFFDYDSTASSYGKYYEYVVIEDGIKKVFKTMKALADWSGISVNSIFNKIALNEPIPNKTTGKSYIVEKVEVKSKKEKGE